MTQNISDPTWTDIAGFGILAAQLVVLVVAAFVAWRQVREARRLREEQNRPFVVIDFERQERTRAILLTISNLGTSLARDVRFDFTPPLESTWSHVPFTELKMFRDGISTLAPGKVIQTIFDISHQRFERREDLPDVYEARVRYTDERGKRPFDERMHLDLGIYWNLTQVERYGVHDIHERLKDIRNELKKWTASGGGLLSLSPDDLSARNERLLAQYGRSSPSRKRRALEALRTAWQRAVRFLRR
jgi:hypothetical protein